MMARSESENENLTLNELLTGSSDVRTDLRSSNTCMVIFWIVKLVVDMSFTLVSNIKSIIGVSFEWLGQWYSD